jgi:hypothetical protein
MMFIYTAIAFSTRVRLPYVPAPYLLAVLGTGCFLIGFLVYRLSLPAHAQFGELFKSLFDQYRSRLQFDDLLNDVASIMGGPTLQSLRQREKNRIVWRYLRWHRIRNDGTGKNLTVKQWEAGHKAAAVSDDGGDEKEDADEKIGEE